MDGHDSDGYGDMDDGMGHDGFGLYAVGDNDHDLPLDFSDPEQMQITLQVRPS